MYSGASRARLRPTASLSPARLHFVIFFIVIGQLDGSFPPVLALPTTSVAARDAGALAAAVSLGVAARTDRRDPHLRRCGLHRCILCLLRGDGGAPPDGYD